MFNMLLSMLRCPTCAGAITPTDAETLVCEDCRRETPVVNGIPRFTAPSGDVVARRTAESFGYEWTTFGDWQPSGETNFAQYFGDLEPRALAGLTVLDAGCGMGRHARLMSDRAGVVVAMDFSQAIDQAATNLEGRPNVACVQGDVLSPPFADGTFDFIYSLGVLHHLTDTQRAVQRLAAKLKPGGRLRLYLYWKRPGLSGLLLKMVEVVRRVTTRLPFGLLRALCALLAAALFLAVVLPYRLLSAIGVRRHAHWPLFVYTRYPFTILYNDQFDRFSAPLEKRYTAGEVEALLRGAGLNDVRVWPSFGWMGEATRGAAAEEARGMRTHAGVA
jgi:SAM-dependent methyltransferase/uncharacterized protein YbaR (Trm112 family)